MAPPFLHPVHAASDGEHLVLWLVMGLGIGVAVVMGAWIFRELMPRGSEDGDSRD